MLSLFNYFYLWKHLRKSAWVWNENKRHPWILKYLVFLPSGATLAMRAAPLALDDMMDWHQAPLPFGSGPTGFRLRRGSRFTWRKECLAVMERWGGGGGGGSGKNKVKGGGVYHLKMYQRIMFGWLCMCLFSYFSDNQYPDEAKREEIATACNAVIQKPGG